jgi:hypothetical protein
MLVLGCLVALAAGFVPRLVFILMWIIGPRVNAAFDSFIVPLLGVIFLPYTTIMYVLVWNPVTGIYGWDWLWLGLGLWLDIMKWGRIAENRKNVPGYPKDASEADDSEAPMAEFTTSDELEKLADLREKGVITQEEFEAKKQKLL